MLRIYLIFFWFFSLAFSLNAEVVKSIDISGNETISRGTVLDYLAIEAGDDINQETVNKAIERINRTDFFSKIDLNFNDGIIKISLIENPTIKFIEITGYESDVVLNEETASKLLSNNNFGPGRIFLEKNFEKLISQLRKLYQDNAFFDAKFNLEKNIDEKNRVGLILKIDENERSLINSFSVSGNKAFDNDEILDTFDMGEADFFLINYFTENDHFSKIKFDAGIESVINKYFSDGYLDMSIDKNILYDQKNKKINISILINEGTQYKIGEIEFSGNLLDANKDSLRKVINVKKGQTFKRAKIVKGIDEIKELFQDKGYAYTKIDSSVIKVKNKEELNVVINIDPDSMIYVTRIEISGNNRTQDDVIRRKLSLLEGQVYSKSQIKESINKIKRLGFFSSVEYDIKRRMNNPDNADLFIEVVETKTGEFTIGLSHSNATGASLNVGVKQENILGTGNVLNAQISNSKAIDEISFYFKNPHINNEGHSMSYGFFDKTLDASNLEASDYSIDEKGVILGYGIPTGIQSNVFAEIRTSSINLTCGNDLKNTYEINDCNSNKDLDFNISASYNFNSLNDSFFPTDGNLINLNSNLSLPIGDFKYYKLTASSKKYYPVFDDKTFKISGRFNYATGYGNDELPFYKRVYEGGSSSVRGFDFNSLGARYSNDKPKGGELSMVSSLGIASPADIVGIDNDNIRLIGFVDAGTIAEKSSDFKIDDVRSSVGLELSWLTPIGPMGLVVAKPILVKDNDKTKTFTFDLGSKF